MNSYLLRIKVIVDVTLYALSPLHCIVVIREFFLMFGAVASSRESLTHVLSSPGGGKAAVLMVGGIPEMDNFHEKQINLVLNKRKGFIKLALRAGSSLVPVFVFGETQVYKQSGIASGLQERIRKMASRNYPNQK